MNINRCLVASAIALAAIATPASAQHGPLGHYTARLGAADHFNSSGERLRSVAAILRQDRANFHRFGRADPEDQGDRFFASANNRAAFEQMIARGRMNEAARYVIVNGEPLVHVDIYEGYVVVTIL